MNQLKNYINLILENIDLDQFSQNLMRAIDKALTSKFFRTSGRFFGNSKIFISPAFSVFSQMFPNFPESKDEDVFKNMLLQANKAGKIRLSRADLTPAMDYQIVQDSEIIYLNATFHLIEVPQEILQKHGLNSYE